MFEATEAFSENEQVKTKQPNYLNTVLPALKRLDALLEHAITAVSTHTGQNGKFNQFR